jgi:hypothetical protein
MSLRVGRGRALGILIAVLATVLRSASTASAETRIGESTSPLTVGHPFPEAKLVKSTASFDTDGTLNLAVETLEPPLEPNDTTLQADAFHAGAGGCTVEAIFPSGAHGGMLSPPAAGVFSKYSEPTALGILLLEEGVPIFLGDAGKVVSGATTSFSISSPEIANLPLDCVVTAVIGPETEGGPLTTLSAMAFPIAVPPPVTPAPPAPPASPVPTPTPSSPPAGSSGPPAPPTAPALSIARPKPLKLGLEEWKTVKVKVVNTGTGDSRRGSLRVRAPKGVAVRPGRQQLPALAPGTSWAASFRVKLTEKAKKKALALTASASGVIGTARLVLKPEP